MSPLARRPLIAVGKQESVKQLIPVHVVLTVVGLTSYHVHLNLIHVVKQENAKMFQAVSVNHIAHGLMSPHVPLFQVQVHVQVN